MAAKADPSALLYQWEVLGAFEVVFVQPGTDRVRTKRRPMGTVVDWRDTEKGKVDNKTDQVLCLLHTSKQEDGAPPYALQARLLDYSHLNTDLLGQIKKGLKSNATLIQTSRRIKAVHKKWLEENKVDEKDEASGEDGQEAVEDEEDEDDADAGGEAAASDEDAADAGAPGDQDDASGDEDFLLVPPAPAPAKVPSPKPGGVAAGGGKKAALKKTGSKDLSASAVPSAAPHKVKEKSQAVKERAEPAPLVLEQGSSKKKRKKSKEEEEEARAAPSTKKLKLSTQGPAEVEGKLDQHYDDLNTLILQHSYGRHSLPVSLIQSPEERYRARIAKQENVDSLEASLLSFGSVNEHVEVVLFQPAKKALPPKAGFKPPLTDEDMKTRGFEGYFTICGDHTQRAMNQLHARFRNNPKWAALTATVYVCPRTPEMYAALKSWGILDNIKGEKRVAVSFQDKVQALHADFLALAEAEGQAGHKERTAQLKQQRCKDFGGISAGQLGQLWVIAARVGTVWDLLARIISGDVTPPPRLHSSNRRARGPRIRVKEVKSAANFTGIGGLEDAVLVPLLQAIVNGHSTLQKLGEKCALIKARMRVQSVILEDVKIAQDSWSDAQEKFPLACNDAFVERWVESVVRQRILQRASLPENFYSELERRITQDLANAALLPRSSQQSLGLDERVFECSLHDQQVKVICHDVMHLSQLQREIARRYALVFWDMPYGMGLAPWDVLLSDLELETFFKNLAVINRAPAHCLVLGVAWHDMGRVRTAMLANGYSDPHPVYNCKPQQNTSGMEWIQAVESMVVAYKGGVRACRLTFPDINPVFRHNFLFGHQVGPKRKFAGEDAEVNTTQKNPNVASTLGRVMCSPGDFALVLGAGSGSEVVGLARVGVNVVGVERDAKQFRALTERLSTEAANSEAAVRQLAEDDAQIQLLKELSAKFTKLNPDVSSHFTEDAACSSAAGDEDSEVGTVLEDEAAPDEKICASCGEGVSVSAMQGCLKSRCAAQTLHAGCMVTCNSCKKLFCSSDCARTHGCSP